MTSASVYAIRFTEFSLLPRLLGSCGVRGEWEMSMCLRARFGLAAHRRDRGFVPHRSPRRAEALGRERLDAKPSPFRVGVQLWSRAVASTQEEHSRTGYRMNLG